MRRVVVIGNSGSGKTTLAGTLACRLGVPHIELDAIYHQPGWTTLPAAEYRARVTARLAGTDSWVVDGNYRALRELIWGQADTLVWLDLPRRIVLPRIVRRSALRVVRRTELWNGNREDWRNLLRLYDPQRSVIAWSMLRHRTYRAEYAAVPADPAWAHLHFVRLRSPAAVNAWVATVDIGIQPIT